MLNRREFIMAGSAGLAVLAHGLPAQAAQRRIFAFNRKWLYGGKTRGGATSAAFDDATFEHITLPHSNRMLPWHSFDDKSYQFVSIYRRHFHLPAALKGHRVFVDFAGVMTAASVFLNGSAVGEHRGGYTPFSIELTNRVDWAGDNVLAVEVDSTERADIPPFGGQIDYLTFGGIYREAELRVVPETFIENVFAQPAEVLTPGRRVDVRCYVNGTAAARGGGLSLSAELRDGGRVLKSTRIPLGQGEKEFQEFALEDLGEIDLWTIDRPKLYDLTVRLTGSGIDDESAVRIGFREARFTDKGFYLNGKHLKLRGLNRHQTYPFVGGAMPARVQHREAQILRKELKCNIVRTSHYPQSPHFLDGCDEAGLLVFEEIPGWQHIGDKAWQDVAVRNVEEMVRRDWNHPSVILWGVRINESQDNHDFYTRTNAAARKLDPSRQTGGVRNIYDSELLEDVFTMNDFRFPLRPPNHPLYLNTEFNGHMFPTKRSDEVDHVAEHVLRHARVHNQLASDDRYAGGIAWCAFDYATHSNFGAGDRICYHGVSDIFRVAKPAAGFYKSQCDPAEEVVLEPGFGWAWGDRPGGNGPGIVPVSSNCDHLKIYIGSELKTEADPDRKLYPNLEHPPFLVDLSNCRFDRWGDLKIEGYLGGKLVATRIISGRGADAELRVEPDDGELAADGSDATRVVLRVTDEYGGARPYSSGSVSLSIDGPGEIVGENPFGLVGGVGAVWVKTKESPGIIRLTARHPYLGVKTIEIRIKPAPDNGI